MEIGQSKTTNMILRFLGDTTKQELDLFALNHSKELYLQIKSQDEMQNTFNYLVSEFLSCLTEEELLDLRSYTGYNFKNINAILRDNWTYEENGYLSEETKMKYIVLSEKIKSILNKFPSLPYNFMTYRGTTLSSFKKYGVNNIEDLLNLKGNYMYEEGFTSTSILEDSCYFNKQLETGKNYNVEIKYMITPEYSEGALLVDNNLSYSSNQNEYLINKNSLSKVIDVSVDKESNTAIITAIIIPEKKWNIQKKEEIKSM